MAKNKSLIPIERIEQSILLIRGHKIMLDRDLAILIWSLDESPQSGSETP